MSCWSYAQMLLGLAASSGGAGSSPASLRSMVAQETVVGLFRDLRGITLATNSRRTYGACCTCCCKAQQ